MFEQMRFLRRSRSDRIAEVLGRQSRSYNPHPATLLFEPRGISGLKGRHNRDIDIGAESIA